MFTWGRIAVLESAYARPEAEAEAGSGSATAARADASSRAGLPTVTAAVARLAALRLSAAPSLCTLPRDNDLNPLNWPLIKPIKWLPSAMMTMLPTIYPITYTVLVRNFVTVQNYVSVLRCSSERPFLRIHVLS